MAEIRRCRSLWCYSNAAWRRFYCSDMCREIEGKRRRKTHRDELRKAGKCQSCQVKPDKKMLGSGPIVCTTKYCRRYGKLISR